jgi:hypothetical protein
VRVLIVTALLVPTGSSAASWQLLRTGDQCITTRSLEVSDPGRVSPSVDASATPQPRRIDARIWYPDPRCSGDQVRFWAYWADTVDGARTKLLERVRALGGDVAAAQRAANATLHTPMAARVSRVLRASQNPVVLIPGEAGEHAPLAEALASHGFVVATLPYQGTFIPEYVAGGADLETQAQDLQRVIGELGALGLGNPTRVGLVCHAISSTACAMLAMRDPRIAALASWEGGLPSSFEQDLLRRSPYFELAALHAPMLVIHAPHPNIDVKLLDPYRFAPQLRMQLPHTSEHHLLVYGLLEELAPGLLKKDVRRAGEALAWAADTLRKFLQAELKNDAAARAALASRPEAAGEIIGEWLLVPASSARVGTLDFQRRLLADGVAGVRAYCREIDCARLVDPETFRRLYAWLSYQPPPLGSERLEFATLRAEIFPKSARARVTLALAARDLGAKALFERERAVAVELLSSDPDPSLDAAARDNLRKLLGEPPHS